METENLSSNFLTQDYYVDADKSRYLCPRCSRSYSTKWYLKVHVCVDNRNESEPGVDIRTEPDPFGERRKESYFCLSGTEALEPNMDIRNKSVPISDIGKDSKPSQDGTTASKCFHCSSCSQYFPRKGYLERHTCVDRQKQASDPLFTCQICSKVFRESHLLECHMKSHNGDQSFNPMLCINSFVENAEIKIKRQLLNHHVDAKSFKCLICSKSFSHLYKLKIHMKSHNGVNIGKEPEPFVERRKESGIIIDETNAQEPNVDSVTDKRKEFELSLDGTKESKRFHCSRCSVSYSTKWNLKIHSCLGMQKRFNCLICSKLFSSAHKWKIHMKYHGGELPFSCVFCTKSFAENYKLKDHLIAHSDDKPFSCLVCSKGFKRSDPFRKHLKIHDKPNS